MMGKGGCITNDCSLLQRETISRQKHCIEREDVMFRHCTVEEKNGSFHKDVGPRNQMERHASQEGDNPTDRNFVSLPFVLLERLIKCLENCNVVEAGCALQLTVENLRTLVKPDVCIASAYEIQTLNRGREISIDCVKTPFELNGIMLLNRPNLESHFYANLANVTGALALKCYKFDIAIEAFLLSVGMHEKSVHADDRDSLFGLGVAQNNIGCVHFIKGELQKAQEAIEVGLNYFNRANRKEISEGDNIMDSEEEIKVTQNNLSLVFQAQRKYQTALQIRSRLLFSKDEKLKLSSRTIVAVMYNQACLSTELCNLGKAVRELEEVKSFCETELDEDDDLLNFLSLKIALIYLMMGRPHCAAASIDVEALMLPDVKEVLGRRRKCSVNFSAATLEVLLDIFVQQGKLDAASSFLADFEPACKETFGADHPRVASIQFRLGSVLFLMGQSIPSKKWLIESLEIFTESFGVNHPDVLKCNVALARVASLAGSQEEILLHSQRVVESVEEIYQESYQVLKKELAGVLLQKGTCLPQVGNEEKIKRESLIADYSVELVSVLYREGPNDLHDSRDTPDGIQDCRYPTEKMSEDICGKLSHDFLKAGLWFFRVGMAVQSNTFLLSACLYCEAFHGSSDHSDVVLLRAILAVCEVRSKCQNILAKKRLLRKEFDSVRRYIEYRTRIGRDPESKMCLFFDEQVNLKTSLALFLPSLVEMEMFNAISVAQELFSRLPYGSNRKNVQITLGEELRCFFAKTPIDCLGRPAIHEFVVSTLVGIDNWTHGLESKTSKQDAMCKTLALPGRRKENDIQPQRFLVTCSTSTQVDIKVLKEINRNSVRSIQANLPSLSLWNENQIAPTQYFIQLKPIVSKETDVSLIRTELDLLLLCLSRSNKQPQSAEESQLVDFVSAEHTCEAALSFTFRKIVASQVLFRKFIVLVLQDQRNLGEVEVLTLHEDFVALNVLSPRKARITLACNGTCINVNSQFVSTRPGPKLCINGLLTCSCTTVETFFREEMEKCTELYGVRYEVLTEKARCISFPPPCTALPVDLAMTKGQRCSLISGLNDHCLVDFEQQEQQTVKSIWLSDVPCQVPSKEVQAAESANQNTCHSNQDDLKRESPRNFVEESVALTACWSSEGFVSHKQPWALRSDPQNSSFIDDVPLLTETFTQTDSLSIPLENEKPNTVESGTQTRVIDSAGFLDNEVDDCTKERRQSNPYSEEFAETRQANIRLGEACSSSQLPGSESVATVPSFPLPMSQRFLWDEELLESEQSTGGDNYSEEEKQELGRLLFEQEKQSRNLRRSCFFLELGQTRHPRITKAESNACSSGGAPAIKDVLVHSGGNHHKEEHDLEDASTQQLRNEMQHELHIIGNPLFCRSQEIDLGGRLDEAVDPFVVTDPNNGEDDVGEQQTKERKCDKPSTDGDGLSMVFCATTTSETSCESNSSFSIQGNAGNDVTDGFVGTETMSSTNWAPQIIADSWREEASVFYPHQTDSNSTSAVEGNLEISVGKELIKGRKIMIREDRIKEEQKRDNGECDGDGIEKAQEQIISGATSGKREGGRERNINRPTKNAISASPFHGGDVETDSSPGCPSRAVHQRFVAGNADDSAGKICSQLEGSILDSPFIESAEETASGLNRNETDAEKLARLVQTSDPDYNDVIETESDHLEVDTSLESEQLNTSYNNWYQQGARPKMLRNPSVDTSNNTLGSTNPDNLSKTPRDSLRFGLNPHFLARHTEDNGMSTGMPPESDAWDEDLQEEEPGDIILEPQTGSQPSPDWRGHYPSLPPSPSLFIKDSNGLWGTREFAMSGSLEQQHINQEQMPSVPDVIPMGTFNRSEGFEQLNNNQGWMPSAPVSAVPPMYPVNPFIPGEHQLTRRYFEDIPRYTPGMFNPHNEWKRNGQMEPLAAADWILPPPPPPSLPNTAVSSMNLHLMGSVSPNAASQIASRGFADEVNRQILPLEAVNWTLPTPHPPSLHNTSVNPYLTGSECFDSATLSFQPNAASQIASIGNADEVGFPRAQPLVPEDDRMMSRLPASNVHENQCGTGWRWSTNVNDSNSRDKTASDKACNTDNSNYEPSTQQSDNSTTSVEDRASSLAILGESRPQSIATCTDSHDSDESLAALERRVAEACALVERVLREKEEKDQLRRERERREREERETREREERERRDRERREREERETREREERERREREASERVQRNEHELGGPIQETPRWLCEHYQRRCRVKFPCCERFYPCHRCHNNSEACQKDDSKAKQATHIECTVCKHQQEINEDSQSCTSCGTLMSAYFCSICRHFTGVDKNPYHCKKCGICRIHQDRSFHCEVCNVCLDKRLQGKHKCRPDSGHDECCICLEDAFSGCQILPCSHKVHKDCAILMIQNGVRTCPICRHPLYNPDRSNRP